MVSRPREGGRHPNRLWPLAPMPGIWWVRFPADPAYASSARAGGSMRPLRLSSGKGRAARQSWGPEHWWYFTNRATAHRGRQKRHNWPCSS